MKRPRVSKREPAAVAEGHLSALGRLVDGAFPDPTQFFDHGLALLVQQLGVDRAVMARLTDLGWEAFWWATAEGTTADAAVHQPAVTFCPQVLEHPQRTLAIKDAAAEAVSASAVAAAVAVTPDVTPAAEVDLTSEPARESTPTTRPIKIDAPIVQLDGLELDDLTVAERLGLASDDDEVGPTS